MADLKISQLNAITVLTPATDVLPVVDSGGVTKKITTNQILGSGGTATLASATITGNLTVDTSTLFVDSSANVVGIGTITPQQNLHVLGTGTTTIAVERSGATIGGRFEFVSGNSTNLVRCVTAKDLVFEQTLGTEVHRIAANGVATWSNVGGVASTAMTLNANGLGIGVTPYVSWPATSKALQLGASSSIEGRSNDGSRTSLYTNAVWDGTNLIYQNAALASYYLQSSGVHSWYTAPAGTAGNAIAFGDAKMTLDASGNLLLGTVTSPTGTKIGSIAKLGKVSVEGTSTVTVTTSATALARAYDTGGLFFVSGFNNVGGSRGWWLVAAGGTAPVVIASDNLTGLTVAFTSPSGVLSMNTASGSLSVTAISLTNQGV